MYIIRCVLDEGSKVLCVLANEVYNNNKLNSKRSYYNYLKANRFYFYKDN